MPKKKKSYAHFEFQVIAGSLKGRRIKAPDLGVTRPPLSRLRKAIFDFLAPYLDEAAYLDLFSGTGSYLFEAVSRGATEVLGVEIETRLVDSINKQATALGVEGQLLCNRGDVFKEIERLSVMGRKFDIIMIAPPQYKQMIDRCLNLLALHPLSAPKGLILCQHDSSESDQIDFGDHEIAQLRKYGNTTFTIIQAK